MADSDAEGGSGEPNVTEEGPFVPGMPVGPSVPHYYGDYVRQIFMFCAAVMLVLSPFFAAQNPSTLMFEIGGAILIAVLGALTNPVRRISIFANAFVSAVGIVTYELLALQSLSSGATIAFIVREMIAVAFLFALYFSLKTLRNMFLRKIGRGERYGEFTNSSR